MLKLRALLRCLGGLTNAWSFDTGFLLENERRDAIGRHAMPRLEGWKKLHAVWLHPLFCYCCHNLIYLANNLC